MRRFFTLLIVLIFNTPALFADVTISASADQSVVALNDSVRVTVTVSGDANVPAPELPDLSDFSVYSSGRSQNISFINGQVSSSITHTYLLTPKRVGSFSIGSFSVTVGGQTYKTQPIPIEVTSASQVPQQSAPASPAPQRSQAKGSPGAFVKMALNKHKAYVNEQVILIFRFYHRVSLAANPQYQPPDLSGFIFEDLPPPRNLVESIQGVQYNVTEIKTALFPVRPGRITIPSASLRIRVEDFSADTDPFSDDFFSRFFSGGGRDYLLKTDPVSLNVEALPIQNKPPFFSGGVGEFKINASLDKSRLTVGEPLTLTLAIEGVGSIKSLSDPEFPDFNGFRKYDTASSYNIEKSGGQVRGSKIYKIILVPQNSGIQTIPPIRFNYFHLPSSQYRTLTTSSFPVQVDPGQTKTFSISAGSPAVPEIKQFSQDIRYIKISQIPNKTFRWIHQSPWFIYLNLIPLLGVLIAGGIRFRNVRIEKNPLKWRQSNAYKRAIKELPKIPADTSNQKTEDISAKIFDVLLNYFADKMLVPPSGLTLKSVQEFLEKSGIQVKTIQDLQQFWSELDFMRYAPSRFRSADIRNSLEQAKKIIEAVEKPLQKTTYYLKSMAWWIICFISVSVLFSQTADQKFQNANQAYQEGQFQNALDLYLQIRQEGFNNGTLEYNLGNTYYRLGQSGQALAHWIRAWRMSPRDSDVRFNLSLISSRLGDSFFPEFIFGRYAQNVFYFFNFSELSILLMAAVWFASIYWIWILMSKRRLAQTPRLVARTETKEPGFFPHQKGESVLAGTVEPFWEGKSPDFLSNPAIQSRNLGLVRTLHFYVLAGMAVIILWWGMRWNNEWKKSWGIVTADKAEIRSGPGKQFGVGFTVPEGRKVLILTRDLPEEWIEIGVSKEGLKGWVESKNVTKI